MLYPIHYWIKLRRRKLCTICAGRFLRAAQEPLDITYFLIDSISIILFPCLSIPISIIFKRAYQYQYFINDSKFPLSIFNINISYQFLLMILLRLPISYQLVIVININIDINYQNRLLSISIQYQLSENPLINFNINLNIAIFAYQYLLINALSSSAVYYSYKVHITSTWLDSI